MESISHQILIQILIKHTLKYTHTQKTYIHTYIQYTYIYIQYTHTYTVIILFFIYF